MASAGPRLRPALTVAARHAWCHVQREAPPAASSVRRLSGVCGAASLADQLPRSAKRRRAGGAAPQAPPAGRAAFHATPAASAEKKDLYEVLGVSRDANKDEIKRAYYKLAKKYHPDTNKDDPNAAGKFADVQNAYEVLSDDSKRQAYNSFGHEAVDGSGGPGGPGGPFGGAGGEGFMDAEELFAQFFGGAARGGGRGGRG